MNADIFELGAKLAAGPNLPPRDGPSDAGGAAAETGSAGTPTNLAERQPTTTRTGPGTRKGDWMGNFRNLRGGNAKTASYYAGIRAGMNFGYSFFHHERTKNA